MRVWMLIHKALVALVLCSHIHRCSSCDLRHVQLIPLSKARKVREAHKRGLLQEIRDWGITSIQMTSLAFNPQITQAVEQSNGVLMLPRWVGCGWVAQVLTCPSFQFLMVYLQLRLILDVTWGGGAEAEALDL